MVKVCLYVAGTGKGLHDGHPLRGSSPAHNGQSGPTLVSANPNFPEECGMFNRHLKVSWSVLVPIQVLGCWLVDGSCSGYHLLHLAPERKRMRLGDYLMGGLLRC